MSESAGERYAAELWELLQVEGGPQRAGNPEDGRVTPEELLVAAERRRFIEYVAAAWTQDERERGSLELLEDDLAMPAASPPEIDALGDAVVVRPLEWN